MFQCYSLKPSHPHLLPRSPKVCSLYLCLFYCLAYKVIITTFLNSIYMHILYWYFSFWLNSPCIIGSSFITSLELIQMNLASFWWPPAWQSVLFNSHWKILKLRGAMTCWRSWGWSPHREGLPRPQPELFPLQCSAPSGPVDCRPSSYELIQQCTGEWVWFFGREPATLPWLSPNHLPIRSF